MLAFDKNKTLAMTPFTFLSKNTSAPFAQLRGKLGQNGDCGCGCGGNGGCLGDYYKYGNNPSWSGLGFTDILQSGADVASSGSILDAVETGANFVPVVGPIASSVTSIFATALRALKFGAGRTEADIIVPLQNQLMDRLGTITNQILLGKTPSCSDLQGLYVEVWQLGLAFMEFVKKPSFTDRRASGQALNTVMPYIDGTCGYSEPLGTIPSVGQRNCLSWGDGTIGGVGTDGMMGALSRAMQANGCTVPSLVPLTQAAAQNVTTTPVSTQGGILTGGGPILAPGTLTQYLPYALAGIALLMFSKAGKW